MQKILVCSSKEKYVIGMGLDISVITNNYDELIDAAYLSNYSANRSKHRLSRSFCNFICRRNVVLHEPELEQIALLTDVDIACIYEMETYPNEETVQSFLEYEADTEEKRNAFLAQVEIDRSKLEGNMDRVLQTINNLLHKLSTIKNLNEKLIQTDFDSLNAEYYFSDFNTDTGEGYIENNFGQDLRNFKRFLEFAQAKEAKTVWFQFG